MRILQSISLFIVSCAITGVVLAASPAAPSASPAAAAPASAASAADAAPIRTPSGIACRVEAGQRKLAGAAQKSFLQRCEKDATAACEAAATERKLSGAARRSHIGKCVRDAMGEVA